MYQNFNVYDTELLVLTLILAAIIYIYIYIYIGEGSNIGHVFFVMVTVPKHTVKCIIH